MLPVTVTEKVQVPPAATVPPVTVISRVPDGTVREPVPQTVVAAVTTASPAGRVSVKPTPVRATAGFGLVMVNCRSIVPPLATVVRVEVAVPPREGPSPVV